MGLGWMGEVLGARWSAVPSPLGVGERYRACRAAESGSDTKS